MLVEFAGIAGSGKSYLCKQLRGWLGDQKIGFIDIDEFIRRRAARDMASVPRIGSGTELLDLGNKSTDVYLRSFGTFFRRYHNYVHEYSNFLFDLERDEKALKSALSAFLFSCARYAYCVETGEIADRDVVVHEEGFSHRLVTLFGYDAIERDLGDRIVNLVERMPVPDVVFWTRCSPATAFDRMLKRSGKGLPERLAGVKRGQVEMILDRAERRLRTAADALQKRGVTVVQVPTDGKFRGERVFAKVFSKVRGKKGPTGR